MKPLTKILLTLSVSMFFMGAVMCGIAYILGNTDLSRLDFDTAYSDKEYVSDYDATNNIIIKTDRHDIVVVESALVANVTLNFKENQYDTFVIEEQSNVITVTNNYLQNAFVKFFCLLFDKNNTDDRTFTITVPLGYEGTINIESKEGDIEVNSLNSLGKLELVAKEGDVLLNALNCVEANVEVDEGELNVVGGVYEKLNILHVNPAQYLPIDEVDPELLPPGVTPLPTVEPTLEPTATPEATLSPIVTIAPSLDPNATPDPDATPEAEATPDPDATPEPTPEPTPKPTKTPTVLVVEAALTFDDVDVTNLNITAHYTNILGTISRGEGYYLIKTNNTETSNIESNDNLAAVGTVTIDQHNGKTELIFR